MHTHLYIHTYIQFSLKYLVQAHYNDCNWATSNPQHILQDYDEITYLRKNLDVWYDAFS